MPKKTNSVKTSQGRRSKRRSYSLKLKPRVAFKLPTVIVVMATLIIIGYFIARAFATGATNPYPCSPNYPVIQHGVSDSSGGRTDKCVSAVQWLFTYSSFRSTILASGGTRYRYNLPSIDGVYDRDGGPNGNDLLWWPIVHLHMWHGGITSGAAAGILTASDMSYLATTFGPFGNASQPSNPPPPPQPPAGGCIETRNERKEIVLSCTEQSPPEQSSPDPTPDDPTLEESNFDSYTSADSLPELSGFKLDDIADASEEKIKDIADNSEVSSDFTVVNNTKIVKGKIRIKPASDTTPGTADEVRYYINGKLKQRVKKPPFIYTLDTTRLNNANYILTVAAYQQSSRLAEKSYRLAVKNNLNLWQIIYNFITWPFGG